MAWCWNKAVSRLANNGINTTDKHRFLYNSLLKLSIFGTFGGWHNSFWLATSTENARVIELDHGIKPDKIFISCYPRMLLNKIIFDDEKMIIDKIIEIKSQYDITILYSPTFRKEGKNTVDVVHPLKIEKFRQLLKTNNVLWIEKNHSIYNQFKDDFVFNDGRIKISSSFDSNLILDVMSPFIDILLTDYSSISSDAIFNNLKTLYWVPDIHNYVNDDRGFVTKFEDYCPGYAAITSNELITYFEKTIDIDYFQNKGIKYASVRKLLFDGCTDNKSMNHIYSSISFITKKKKEN